MARRAGPGASSGALQVRLGELGGWVLRPADAATGHLLLSWYDVAFNHLRSQALDIKRSRAFIRDVIKEIR
ncbi:hypothetical protein OHS81_00385 [Streptomyces sp. NBC_00400]|uniref:hypothetical protein n=1 Tax=Streptomyces sp. NBC_00400 TaxID=2975737 RepID=UPI002E230719